MPRNLHPDLVAWRQRHGSKCEWCPLNGRRKVGADGPADAPHVGFGDWPSTAESEFGSTRGFEFGRAFSGGAGYFWKLEYLVPNGLAALVQRPGKEWPGVELTKIQVLNVAMCQPDKEKSVEAKHALRCCANGLRAWLRRRLRENPDIMLHPIGGPALEALLRDKAAIDAYRGRLLTALEWETLLADEPELEIAKAVFRGKKPTDPTFLSVEPVLMQILRWQRSGLTKQEKAAAKAALPAELAIVEVVVKRQRMALRKAAKTTESKEAA